MPTEFQLKRSAAVVFLFLLLLLLLLLDSVLGFGPLIKFHWFAFPQLDLPRFFHSMQVWLIAMSNGGNPPFAQELALHQVIPHM